MKLYSTLLIALLVLGGCAAEVVPSDALGTADNFGNFEPEATGRSLYVSPTGDDENDGLSETTPFETIQAAVWNSQPGDTVYVMNGTYSTPGPNTHVVDIQKGGEPDNYVIYRAYPGHKPIIKVDNNYTGIRITTSYVVVQGFTVEGINPELSFEEADALARGSDDEALYNTRYNSSGISSYPEGERVPHHLIIRNNDVSNLPGAGISSNGSDYVRVEHNTVYNNAYYSPYANSGISFYASKTLDTRADAKMFVRGNIVYKNENKVPWWFSSADPAGRSITDGNGIIIDDSLSEEGGAAYTGRFIIQNNLVFDNGGRGVNIFQSANVRVGNNTFYRNGRSPGFSEFGIGRSNDVRFHANVFSARSDRDVSLFYESSEVGVGRNIFVGDSAALPSALREGNVFVSEMGFILPSTDPQSADFRLSASSPAVDQQIAWIPGRDIEGTPRPKGTSSDFGAYESH